VPTPLSRDRDLAHDRIADRVIDRTRVRVEAFEVAPANAIHIVAAGERAGEEERNDS
jgi:hypothetical protein